MAAAVAAVARLLPESLDLGLLRQQQLPILSDLAGKRVLCMVVASNEPSVREPIRRLVPPLADYGLESYSLMGVVVLAR